MNQISVVFVGTGSFGAPILSNLAQDKRFRIPFVITGKDKPQGRGMKESINPIKDCAKLNNIIIQQTDKLADLKEKLVQEKPDFFLVVSYGEIIQEKILNIPVIASINVHGSLLPKYRGASPIQQAILEGDRETGISWIIMNKKMDTGDVISMAHHPINTADTFETLYNSLSEFAAAKTPDVLAEFAKNRVSKPQNDLKATYCTKISKEDGVINVERDSAEQIVRKIRAYTPWPGCTLFWNGKRIKVLKAEVVEQKIDTGKMFIDKDNFVIGTKEKSLKLLRVQPESKRPMEIQDFVRGYATSSSS